MESGWTIGDERITVTTEALQTIVRVDSVPTIAMREGYLGEWTVPLAGMRATFRRVRTSGVPASELWIDDVQIPLSPSTLRRGLPPANTACPKHAEGERYRAPVTPATVTCASCDAPRCLDCLAVDGVRCEDCFAAARRELERTRNAAAYRRAVLVLSAGAVTTTFGVIVEAPFLVAVSIALVALTGVSAWAHRYRLRKDREHIANRTDEERALLQDGAEIRARDWRRGAPAAAPASVPEAIAPPTFGPYLQDPLRFDGRTLLPSGSPLPATTSIEVAPTARDQRDVELDLDIATFRVTALRPLHADDRVRFTITIATDGAVSATALDRESDAELHVTRVDADEKRASVAYR